MSNLTTIDFVKLIHRDGDRLFVTSLKVSGHFGKQHKNIIQAIENLECSQEFRQLNFQPSSYNNSQNKAQPMYEITRDGFAFLVMGFTGKQAALWKERYIQAFNWMYDKLHTQTAIEDHDELQQQFAYTQAELLKSRPRLLDVFKLSNCGYGRRKIARMLKVNESTVRGDVKLLTDCGFPMQASTQQLDVFGGVQ